MKTIFAGAMLLMSCAAVSADDLDDMPELACSRASSALEREQIGCGEPNLTKVRTRRQLSPLDRFEADEEN